MTQIVNYVFRMPDARHTWIYLSLSPDGMRWPARNTSANSATYTRVPGRWLSSTEFETTDGGVLVIPAPDANSERAGLLSWRGSEPTRP